jgi:chromosome partitioning protein
MRPRCVAVISSKGGVGKTTICASLAVRAAKESDKVALLDVDPQQALARWWELRGSPDNPKLFMNDGGACDDPTGDVVVLKDRNWEWTFIDTPPAMMDKIVLSVAAADAVIILARPSPIDLESLDPAVQVCEEYGKPFAFVLTHFDKSWKLSKTAAPFLADMGKVLPTTIGYRQSFVGAMIAGKTGPEYHDRPQAKTAAEEIDALWKEVKRLTKMPRGH